MVGSMKNGLREDFPDLKDSLDLGETGQDQEDSVKKQSSRPRSWPETLDMRQKVGFWNLKFQAEQSREAR